MYASDELIEHSWEGYFGVYFPICEATKEINTKITLEWEQNQFVMRVHALINFLLDIMNPQMMIKMTILTHCPHVSLTRFSFCWWHHNQLLMTSQWPDNCDVIMWIMIPNSLDIDFIHADIHGHSCKNKGFIKVVLAMLELWLQINHGCGGFNEQKLRILAHHYNIMWKLK